MTNIIQYKDITPESLRKFGTQVANRVSDNAKKIMENVGTKDVGEIGEDLKNLILSLEKNSIDKIENQGFFGRLINRSKMGIKEFQLNLKQVNPQIDHVVKKLKDHSFKLEKELIGLDVFSKSNLESMKELGVLKKTLDEAIRNIEEEKIPELKEKLKNPEENEALVNQEIIAINSFKDRIKKKRLELNQIEVLCIQTVGQIQLMTAGHENMIAKLSDCEHIAIPAWRNAFTIAVASETQRKTLETVKNVANFTNKVIKKNADNLEINSVEIAKQSSSTIIDTDSLKYSVEKLSATFKSVAEIYNTNMSNMEKAQEDLDRLQKSLVLIGSDENN